MADLRDGPAPPRRGAGVYVHFPYCAKKCPYCDFNSHVVDHDDAAYADVVLAELEHRAAEIAGPLVSIYFGGGTPSRWAPEQVGRVIRAIRDRLGLEEDAEITLEANPGTVAEARLVAYVAEGVNRFSIGTQSFIDAELEALGRIHDAAAGRRAVEIAQRTGARVSLDLIYAQPGQSRADVDRSLDVALALAPDHVSAYTLTVEPDTILGRQKRLGLFVEMADDDQADLIEHVTGRLADAGYERYEVSSYAKPGRRAVHNSLYWTGAPYLGLGAGAHGFTYASDLSAGRRYGNVKAPERYLTGRFETFFDEAQDRRDLLTDRLWVGLRPIWGVDVGALAERATAPGLLALAPTLDRLVAEDLLIAEGTRYRPTARGFLFADRIARVILDAMAQLDIDEGPPPKSTCWADRATRNSN